MHLILFESSLAFFFFFFPHKPFVSLLTPVLRKDPYRFTLEECVLGWKRQASVASAVLLHLLHGPRIRTVNHHSLCRWEDKSGLTSCSPRKGLKSHFCGIGLTIPPTTPNRILCLAQHFPSRGPSFLALLTWGQAWWPEVVASWKST